MTITAIAIVALIALGAVGGRRWWSPSSAAKPLAPADRVVAVQVVTADGTPPIALPADAPTFTDAAAALFALEWRRLELLRRFRVRAVAQGTLLAQVTVRPEGDGVSARLEVGPPGHLALAGEVHAGSIRDAANALYPALAAHAGAGHVGVELFPEERDEMRDLGAPDPQAYKQLVTAFDDSYSILLAPERPYMVALDELLAKYPDWGQAAALRLDESGLYGDTTRRLLPASLAAARATGRDPLGVKLLEAFDAYAAGKRSDAAFTTELTRLRPNRIVLLCLMRTSGSGSGIHAYADAARLALASRFPDLQFGGDHYRELLGSGQVTDAMTFLHDALRRAPAQEQLWFDLHGAALDRRDDASEGQLEGAILLLYGRSGPAALTLAEHELERLQLTEAANLASPLLIDSFLGVHALELLGKVEVLSGHFDRAAELMQRAWDRAHADSPDSKNLYYIQYAYELMRLAELEGGWEGAARWRAEMLAKTEQFGVPAAWQAPFRYLAEHARSSRCPDPQRFLNGIDADAGRHLATTRMTAAATQVGCAPCRAVLAAGEVREDLAQTWTIDFARCAVEERARLDEAERALARVHIGLWQFGADGPAAVDFALATYWLGRVREAKGDPAGARASYDRFLSFWGAADIVVPEVVDARRRDAALPPPTP